MKKNLTEIVFILDRSGSMGGLESDTIGGFNAMLEKQKTEKGDALRAQMDAFITKLKAETIRRALSLMALRWEEKNRFRMAIGA